MIQSGVDVVIAIGCVIVLTHENLRSPKRVSTKLAKDLFSSLVWCCKNLLFKFFDSPMYRTPLKS